MRDEIDPPYVVLGRLGEGGFGTVYLIRIGDTGQLYALKTLKPIREGFAQRAFRQELDLWLTLERHPHVVFAHSIERYGDSLALVLEYIPPDEDGRVTLRHHLSGRTHGVVQLLTWMSQCCEGLSHAVARGLRCHRDLKPENVLISPDGVAKVSDFGLAQVTRAARVGPSGLESRVIAGTLPYMSPEQFDADADLDARADIYGMGIMLYEMIAGRVPFIANTFADWQRVHATARPPALSSPAWSIIQRCLEKDKERRYESWDELGQALGAVLASLGASPDTQGGARTTSASDWNNMGLGLMQLGRLEEALTCFDSAVLSEPAFARCWSNRGSVLSMLERSDDALESYERAVRLDPSLVRTWDNIGQLHTSACRYAAALVAYRKALIVDADYVPALNNRALTYLALDDPAAAAADMRRARVLRPRSAALAFAAAGVFKRAGAWTEAIDAFEAVLATESRTDLYAPLAECHANAADWDKAVPMARRAVQANDADARCHALLADILVQRGEVDEATTAYEAALSRDGTNARLWYSYGNALRSTKSFSRALRAYEQAIEHAPTLSIAWVNLGAVLCELGRHAEAIVCLTRAVEIEPDDMIAWWNLAAAQLQVGLEAGAGASYRVIARGGHATPPQMVEYARAWLARGVSPGRQDTG